MSIVQLAGNVPSRINLSDLHQFATSIGLDIDLAEDADDYLVLLRSLEGILCCIKDGPDYIHPELVPQPVEGCRDHWKPDPTDNILNAWSHRCELKAANPTSGLLKGRTVAIKDNISVGGLPTTLGTVPGVLRSGQGFLLSEIDATVVGRILAAGAVIKGTSTCESFCASPLSYTSFPRPVDNPLLEGYTAGGSSSGSAVLVAANAIKSEQGKFLGETVELAIGTDQAGSVRNPACFNGLYGLKPTFGLIPYTGAGSMSPMIDHIGPIAATLEDTALLLNVMAGYDGLDCRMSPESPLAVQVEDYTEHLRDIQRDILASNVSLSVGFLRESFELTGIAPEVHDAIMKGARSSFEAAGATVVDVSVPMHTEGPIIWTAATRPSMSSWLCQGRPSGHLAYIPSHLKAEWPPTKEAFETLAVTNPAVINIMLSELLAKHKFGPSLEAKAHRKVFELRAAYDRALEGLDVLITPCAPSVAMPHPLLRDEQGKVTGVLERLKIAVGITNNTCPFNVTGHPAMSVPCGSAPAPTQPEVKLPIGMQIIARHWNEGAIFRAAALFEEGRKRTGSL